jgi:hypothetical protein
MADGIYNCLRILADEKGLDTSIFDDPKFRSSAIEYLFEVLNIVVDDAVGEAESSAPPEESTSTAHIGYMDSLN